MFRSTTINERLPLLLSPRRSSCQRNATVSPSANTRGASASTPAIGFGRSETRTSVVHVVPPSFENDITGVSANTDVTEFVFRS